MQLGAVLAHHLCEGFGNVFVGFGDVAAAEQRRRGYRARLDAVRCLQQVVVYLFGDYGVFSEKFNLL